MKNAFSLLISLIIVLFAGPKAYAQQYKIRQVTTTMNVKSESTVYVKAKRKRTETGAMMGMPKPPVSIEQCDKQRTIWLSDKKKLYFIEPFQKEDVIDDDGVNATASGSKNTAAANTSATPKAGGIITMIYNITDTGERKKMNGFTARHVWTSQRMIPSRDACMMKDSLVIKTDGWYIDLPEFNCPIRYTPATQFGKNQPECTDKFVTRRSGKGKLGFPLSETRTIIMNGTSNTEMTVQMETLEFSTAALDSMLFEIPAGYNLASDMAALQEQPDVRQMMSQANDRADKENEQTVDLNHKAEGHIRIGVYQPVVDGAPDRNELQRYLSGVLTGGTIEAIPVSSEEEAKKYNCDYSLKTDFAEIKQAGKIGGMLKAIKNADPNAASAYNIQANFSLKKLADGSIPTKPTISGKYQGNANEASKRALDKGGREVLKAIR